jgi:hypothetical protein
MRKILVLISLLATTCLSWSQSDPSIWENLKALQPGQKIRVLEANSTTLSGTFVSVSDTAISLDAASGPQTIQRLDVRSVKLLENKHRLRNTLIGAGVGAGAGAGISAGVWESGGFFGGKGTGAAVGAGIGAAAGAIVGALLPTHDTIYRVGAH